MEAEVKTLIVAEIGRTKDYRHFVAYVLDGNGNQHLVTPLNHSGNQMRSGKPAATYRHGYWDCPKEKAIRACRWEAEKLGHGRHYLVVFVSGNNETAQYSGDSDYRKETC